MVHVKNFSRLIIYKKVTIFGIEKKRLQFIEKGLNFEKWINQKDSTGFLHAFKPKNYTNGLEKLKKMMGILNTRPSMKT